MGWNTFEAALLGYGQVMFVVYFLLLFLILYFERKVTSAVLSLMILAVANGVMTTITPVLYDFSTNQGLFYKFVWYGGFVLLDFISLFLLYKFHVLLNRNVGGVAHLVGLSFCLFAVIQTLRFIDRYLLDTQWLHLMYQYSIPILNILLVPFIVALWVIQDNSVSGNSQVVSG